MFMPVYGTWIYVQYKWMSLGPFKRVVWSALCFEKSTLDTLQNRDCWTVRVNAETWEMMMIWDVVGFKTYFRSIVFCVKCWRYSWKQVRHGSCPNRIFSQMGEGGNWTSNRECQENLPEEVSRESEVRAQILSCSGNQWWVERETWDSLLFSMWQLWTANKRFSIPDPSQRPVSALSVLAQSKRNHVYAWEIFEVLVHRMLYLKIYQNKVYFFIKIAWLIDNSILYCKVKQIFH